MTTIPRRETFLDMNRQLGGRDTGEISPDMPAPTGETQARSFTLLRSKHRSKRLRRDMAAHPGSLRKRSKRPQNGEAEAEATVSISRQDLPEGRSRGSWLRRNFGLSALRRRYFGALVPAHTLLFDRRFERLLFRRTAKSTLSGSHSVPAAASAEAEAGIVYDGPVPYQVFRWMLAALPSDLREYAFVDFRAGKGRTLLYAAMHDFDRVIGFEYDEGLHDDARMNIAQFPRFLMRCRNVECHRGDCDGITVPDQPAILFFPNAFRERFMALIMNHVSASYRLNPRRIYVVMENPPRSPLTGQEDIFYELKMPPLLQLKLALLSPVEIKIYRSLV